MIIQITGQTYTPGFVPPGLWYVHMLFCNAMNGWSHYTSIVGNNGVTTPSNVLSDPAGITLTPYTARLDATGKVTYDEMPSAHGQVSHDGKFVVGTQTTQTGTQTNGTGVFSLSVSTK